jgi:hypothetical protein
MTRINVPVEVDDSWWPVKPWPRLGSGVVRMEETESDSDEEDEDNILKCNWIEIESVL